MLIAWGILILCAFVGGSKLKEFGATLIGTYICIKLSQLIYTPIVGLAIYKALDTTNENIDRVDNLEIVANCMDDQTTLDTDQVISGLNDQKDLIVTCFNMWWASIVMFGVEVLCGFILLLGSCWIENRNRDFDFWDEYKAWIKTYLILN